MKLLGQRKTWGALELVNAAHEWPQVSIKQLNKKRGGKKAVNYKWWLVLTRYSLGNYPTNTLLILKSDESKRKQQIQ